MNQGTFNLKILPSVSLFSRSLYTSAVAFRCHMTIVASLSTLQAYEGSSSKFKKEQQGGVIQSYIFFNTITGKKNSSNDFLKCSVECGVECSVDVRGFIFRVGEIISACSHQHAGWLEDSLRGQGLLEGERSPQRKCSSLYSNSSLSLKQPS